MPRLVKVAAMEPQRILLGRFPHVAQFAFPRARVFGGIRAKPPTLANLICHFLRDKPRRPAIHRAIAGGEHNQIGRQLRAIGQNQRIFGEVICLARRQFDLAIRDQLGRANVNVCLLYTSPSPRDLSTSRMPSSA